MFYSFGDSNRIQFFCVKERNGCVSLFIGKEPSVHEGFVGSVTFGYFKLFAFLKKAEGRAIGNFIYRSRDFHRF